MTLEEAKKDMERFVSLKTSMRPAFVDVLLQAEEVRHGHWISRYHDENGCNYYTHICSKCAIETLMRTTYCPRCGAKMDEVKDE